MDATTGASNSENSTKRAQPRILNINVGVLGHVDSGKTSLVAALSTKLSTAALDKHPQSKERGITLDLGFSSFTVPLPEHLKHLPYDELQFTLVDCPGHASLIRTIIGGAQIIDLMVLVVDITKGLQTQTAECLVVGEVTTGSMVVALNKCDLIPAEERTKTIKKACKRLAQTFDFTKFAGVKMIPVMARPGGGATMSGPGAAEGVQGVEELKATLTSMVPPEIRPPSSKPFLFAIDHCFPIKGQGTVLTGTVLQGSVSVGDTIELPMLKATHKVRSMQMFKQPVNKASRGDRVGICVTQLSAGAVERGLACAPGSVPTFTGAVAMVEKIRFFAGQVPSKSKFHISVGHSTVMANLTFFGLPDEEGVSKEAALAQMIENLGNIALPDGSTPFNRSREYVYQEQLYGLEGRPCGQGSAGAWDEQSEAGGLRHYGPQWVLLNFEQPVTAPADALIIGAKFDADVHGESCRLAFYGRISTLIDPARQGDLASIRIYKVKEKRGIIERVIPEQNTAIVRGMFKKETDPSVYVGLKVVTVKGEAGVIEGSFGKSGKLRIMFPSGISQAGRSSEDNIVLLYCKRYIHDTDRKRLKQTFLERFIDC